MGRSLVPFQSTSGGRRTKRCKSALQEPNRERQIAPVTVRWIEPEPRRARASAAPRT